MLIRSGDLCLWQDLNKDYTPQGSSLCPGSLCLRRHGSLEALRDPDVLDLDPLHSDAPGVCGLVQRGLKVACDQRQDAECIDIHLHVIGDGLTI